MSKVIKIILFFIFFIFLALYFFISTTTGKKLTYAMMSYAITQKLGIPTQVQSFDIHHYPYIKTHLLMDDTYQLNVDGFYENATLNLRYTLTSQCLESNLCKIEDSVNIKGYIKGALSNVSIDGKGTALEGHISYKGYKQVNIFKNVTIELIQFNATKLFKLLGQTALLQGEAMLDTRINVEGYYDISEKSLHLDGTLSPLHFIENNLTKSLLKKTNFDISKEIFTDNHIHIKTKKDKILTDLTIKNSKNNLIFKDTYINTENHTIQSNIDVKLAKHTVKGNLLIKLDTYTKTQDTFVDFDGWIEKHYALQLRGLINPTWTTMDYAIQAKRVPSPVCTIVDDMNLSGHINGSLTRLHITGKGHIFDGAVNYETLKDHNTFKDTRIVLQNIHSQKLSTLLGYPNIPYGKVDINAQFKVLNTHTKHGNIDFSIHHATYATLPLSLHGHVQIEDEKQSFESNVTLGNAHIHLSQGSHTIDSHQTHAFYTLTVKDLSEFESLLGYKYLGSLYAIGTIDYKNSFQVHGLSKTFGGLTEFDYRDNQLRIDLNNTSFKSVMGLFPYPLMIDAKTTGNIFYDFHINKLYVKTKLYQAKFLHTKLIDTIYSKSGVNMLRETFPQSTLDLTLYNHLLVGNLMMRNQTSHFLLTKTTLDTEKNNINAYFDLNMQEKEFSGNINGSLSNPEIHLNMQKLLEHEMDKQLDSIVGESNRKIMENMPMGNTAKDMATGMGGAFMEMFF